MADVHGTVPYWRRTFTPRPRPPLAADARADVCIVGAGIAGLNAAYRLAQEGLKVLVVDKLGIATGQTGRTTAHLSFAIDDRFHWLERVHGREATVLAAQSHRWAVDAIQEIVETEGIDCEFERLPGYLFPAADRGVEELDSEYEAARRANVPVEKVDRVPWPPDQGPALRFPDQGQFHPTRYAEGLATAVERMGGVIHGDTTVTRIDDEDAGARVRLRAGHTIHADTAVVATNTPVNVRVGVHARQAPYRTYVVAYENPEAVPRALFWETGSPYKFIRTAAQGTVALVGGDDHKTGQAHHPRNRWGRIEAWIHDRDPRLRVVTDRWSGQVMEPADGLSYIGRQAGMKNVLIVTGDSGMGMTHGTFAGRVVRDLVLGIDHPWARLYDPSRTRGLKELLREQANAMAEYARHLAPGEVKDPNDIAPGSGAILRRAGKPLAVYRDASGAFVERSAVCRHLGCIVQWNSAESSWDCPCHGSRYDPQGRVLLGPAKQPLPDAGRGEEETPVGEAT